MVQRLASSMRPTIYASAASCRHIMVLPWKHKSYLPTSRAISWTSHEKVSFLIRSSVLFWNCWIPLRAAVPSRYFLGFLTLPAWMNSFWGALPPTVGQSFLLTGSSPKADDPASAAIWANCWVGNDNGDLPTSSSHLASSTPSLPLPTSSPPPSQVRAFWLGMGGAPERVASFLFLLFSSWLPLVGGPTCPLSSPFWASL